MDTSIRKSGRSAALFTAMVIASSAAWAASDAIFLNPNEMQWGPAPPSVPAGAKVSVLYGDPSAAGPFVLRLYVPPGYTIAPHWHSNAESLTVITGTLYLGEGDTPNPKVAHAIKAHGFHYLPAKQHHFASSRMGTVVQIHGDGPFDITYVNDKDDPQKMAKK
jgi:hypothetical protein